METIKKREYLFDNYKVLLIFLVIVGHFIEPSYQNNRFLYELKWYIVAFHMPAFIFISGYFSKKETSWFKLLRTLVIPYFVYEILYYILYTFFLGKETGLYFARPKFSLWYLMALFAWRILAPWVRKIPYHMILSVLAGLLIGYTQLGNFLSIPRILFFFPFFLAGMNFDSSCLEKYRNKKGYLISLSILALFAVFLFTDDFHTTLSTKIFYGRYSYADTNLSAITGPLIRLICYGISFVMIYMFMLVLPNEKKSYTYLGERTMAIYIFHGFIYSCVKYGTSMLYQIDSYFSSILLLIFCGFLVWFLGLKPFVRFTNRINHLI